MTLRFKALGIILLIFLALIAVLYLVSYNVLMQSFAKLERDITAQHVERVQEAIAREVTALETLASDWAEWDDTYKFIQNHNTEYIESNLVDSTFASLRLNLMLLIDSSGNTVYGKAFDLLNEIALPVPQSFKDYLYSDKFLLTPTDTENRITGLILLLENPMLVASRAILTSDKEGPSKGTLIMGRSLDDTHIEQLEEQTLLSLSLYRLTNSKRPPDIGAAISAISEAKPVFVQPLSEEKVAGYALLSDIRSKPILVLRVDTSRDVYQQGQATFNYFLIFMVMAGLAVMAVAMLFIENQVLSRLSNLSRNVSDIGKSGKPVARVFVSGKDELSNLADEINKMLMAIQQFQSELHEKNWQLNGQAEELKKKQQELIEKGNELKTASQAKSDFIASLSHEIRTPLNAIMGFSELLMDDIPGALNEEQKQCLSDIYNSGQHLLKLINDILDLSKIEAGKMETKLEDLNLPDIINSVIHTTKPIVESSHHRLTVNIPAELPPVYADEKRLKQVALNLLSNAIKFTLPGGKINIEVTRDNGWCQVSVIDSGIGIKKEDQERIFEAFVQAENPPDGIKTGTGLGLTLTRQFVGIWDGRIWVESEYGKGSKFTFTIPLAGKNKTQSA